MKGIFSTLFLTEYCSIPNRVAGRLQFRGTRTRKSALQTGKIYLLVLECKQIYFAEYSTAKLQFRCTQTRTSALLSGRISLFALSLLALWLTACHPPEQESAADQLDWPSVNQTTQPWSRWWWMGNAVDQKNLDTLLEQYAKAGLGGVEITPIYGAIGYEDQYLNYLSPEWMDVLRFTVKKADSLGMGVDMNLGTGWPFGGPQITPEHAASKLFVQQYTLNEGQALEEKLIIRDPKQQAPGVQLMALMGYGEEGQVVDLYDKVAEDGTLNWSPDPGSWELYAAFLGKTRQQVKRAAPGGAGYTMDHLSKEALDVYLQRFEEAFGENAPGIRSYFNDSYEVYNADLSPEIFDEFEQMHGYDVRQHLKALVSTDTTEEVLRIKADYRQTMAHMLLHNFTLPWTQWIHEQQALSRNQAHGSPGNLLDLYAAVDIPECETFGSTNFPIPGLHKYTSDTRNVEPDPVMMKFASSAAHITGKPLVSSETFTWLGEHFKVSLAQAKPEVEQVFLAGVNHVFFHGTTYSPQEAGWPGWMFYASVNFAPSNSFWPHVKGLNEYITRCQSVLQSGTADHEVMVYWPIYDLWHHGDPERLERQLTIHGIEEWLHSSAFYQIVSGLMKTGYGVDFVSDQLLDSIRVSEGSLCAAAKGSSYQVLVIPQSSFMPVSTFERILTLAREGSTVIFQQLPEDVPGWHALTSRRQQLHDLKASLPWTEAENGIQEAKTGDGTILLSEDVQEALAYAGIAREELVDTGLKFVRRAIEDDKYYYLVNHTSSEIDTRIPLNVAASAVVILDPQDGRRGLADAVTEEGKTRVRVQIAPGESLILRTTTHRAADIPPWLYLDHPGEPIAVSGPWQLAFTQGGPALPPTQQLDQLLSWTELPDTNATRFSGTAMYTTSFNLPEKSADEYLLQLGDVRESARVWVNDQEVGILWSVPYQARIGPYLQEGENILKIEVANLMANRIRDLDLRGVEWRKYHEINFVNLSYEPFDASGWEPQPSGLLGPVSILPIMTDHTL